jgi:hypothetical protein
MVEQKLWDGACNTSLLAELHIQEFSAYEFLLSLLFPGAFSHFLLPYRV